MSDHRTLARLPVAALAAALLLAGQAEAQTWRTLTSARQVWDKAPLDVQIQYGAGQLRLEAADAPMLYRMEMRYDEEQFAPVTEYNADRRVLKLGVDGRSRTNVKTRGGSRATIGLTREVPLDLDLEFGAGEAEIDLGGVALRRLDISTGASDTEIRFGAPNPIDATRVSIEAGAAELEVVGLGNTAAERFSFQGGVGSTLLDFSGQWRRNATASVQMGIGSVTLRFPRGLGVRLNRDSFLSSFDSEGLVKKGNSYFSPDWDSATHRLTVDVNAAFGSIKVEWIS